MILLTAKFKEYYIRRDEGKLKMEIFKKIFGKNKAPLTEELPEEKIQSQVEQILKSRMHPDSPEIYRQTGESLKEYRGEELTNLVREYMSDSDETVRMRASSLLSDFSKEGDKSVIPDLIGALKDNAESVQSAAVEGLGHSGAVEAIDPIIDAVSTVYLRSYDAAEALNKIDLQKASEVLRNKLATDSIDKYEWATMLVDLNDISAIPLLKKHLDRGDFDAYNKRSIAQFIENHSKINKSEEN